MSAKPRSPSLVSVFCPTSLVTEIGARHDYVTAEGQITLPSDVLEHHGVHPGETIAVDKLPNGRIELRAARPISDIFGSLKAKRKGRPLSIEDINELAAKGWSGKR